MSGAASQAARAAAGIEEIASAIDGRRPDAVLIELLGAANALCERAAATQTAEGKVALTTLATALQTWQQVWPRLGREQDFRLAVAREARLWAKRLGAFAGHA